ncbi:hypothetical protein H8959_011552 [Pygathrix nigripes]
MSEEVTYATLTFQDYAGARNNRHGNNLRKKGRSSENTSWVLGEWTGVKRFEVPALMLVLKTVCCEISKMGTNLVECLRRISNDINSDSEKLSQLQKTIHQRQDNLSQQLGNSNNLSIEEEFLKSQISSLLKRQEQMAIKLCQELIIHASDHRCNPCPKMWQWYQNSCYYFTTNEEKTWTNSRKDCIDKNSTLLKIDTLEEKVHCISEHRLKGFLENKKQTNNKKNVSHLTWFYPTREEDHILTDTEIVRVGTLHFAKSLNPVLTCSLQVAMKVEDGYITLNTEI